MRLQYDRVPGWSSAFGRPHLMIQRRRIPLGTIQWASMYPQDIAAGKGKRNLRFSQTGPEARARTSRIPLLWWMIIVDTNAVMRFSVGVFCIWFSLRQTLKLALKNSSKSLFELKLVNQDELSSDILNEKKNSKIILWDIEKVGGPPSYWKSLLQVDCLGSADGSADPPICAKWLHWVYFRA